MENILAQPRIANSGEKRGRHMNKKKFEIHQGTDMGGQKQHGPSGQRVMFKTMKQAQPVKGG